MKIVCVIQARMGSARLPKKQLMKIKGKPMLEHIILRLKKSRLIDEIVVATTKLPEDISIIELAEKLNTKYYRGSTEDVLKRMLEAAESENADIIVRITGDRPLVDSKLVDDVIKKFIDRKPDFATNTSPYTHQLPIGLDVEVVSLKSLSRVDKITNNPSDREHVTLYYYKHPEKFKIVFIKTPKKLYRPELRWTVDTKEDLEFVKRVYDELYNKNKFFSTEEVLSLLKTKPEIIKINSNIKQKKV